MSVGEVALDWRKAWRIVSSRFPPVGLFDAVADAADLDKVYALESLTNPRVREQVGDLQLVPPERRISGPGTTPIMSAFTHLNPQGSRFADGSYGIYYAAHERETAIRETVFHREVFLRESHTPATEMDMRCYIAAIKGSFDDIRGIRPQLHKPDSYGASQAFALKRRVKGSNGIVFDSVRHPGGQAVAVFYPDLVSKCRQAEHLCYVWDGERITDVLRKTLALKLADQM